MKNLKIVVCSILVLSFCFVLAACGETEPKDFNASLFKIDENAEYLYDGQSHMFEVEYDDADLEVEILYSLDKITYKTADEMNLTGSDDEMATYNVYFKATAEGYNDYVSEAVVVKFVPKAVELKVGSNYTYYTSLADAVADVETSAEIKLYDSLDLPTAVEFTKEVVLDLNGNDITLTQDTQGNGAFWVKEGGKLTINGEGVVNGLGNNPYHIAVWADGGEIIINGGTYTNKGAASEVDGNHFDVIYVKHGGLVTINGGFFSGETPRWILNSHNTLGGTFVVKGGVFEGFDPSAANTDEPGGISNWLADGYKVETEEVDGVTYYSVVEE